MSTSPVRAAEMRRTETPNAAMTTLASPSQGSSERLSMWRVAMQPGQQGPRHAFADEQIWHVLDGQLEIAVAGDVLHLGTGDAVVLPAGVERQVTAASAVHLIVSGPVSEVSAPGAAQTTGVPPWIS